LPFKFNLQRYIVVVDEAHTQRGGAVHKLNAVVTRSLKALWFQSLRLSSPKP
jgi:hypothetical protein